MKQNFKALESIYGGKVWAFVLVHRKTGRVVPEGGISYREGDTKPHKQYSKEYLALPVLLVTPIKKSKKKI